MKNWGHCIYKNKYIVWKMCMLNIKKYVNNFKNVCVAPFQFWIYCELKGMNKERFQAKLSLQKKIKNQDEEKKGKNIDGEVER